MNPEPYRPTRRFHIDQCPKCDRPLTDKEKDRLEKLGKWEVFGPSVGNKKFVCTSCYFASNNA